MLSPSGSGVAAAGARRAAVLWAFVLLLASEREARAYTDPGTGALLWQVLAAGFVGCLFYFRKFFSVLRKRRRKTE